MGCDSIRITTFDNLILKELVEAVVVTEGSGYDYILFTERNGNRHMWNHNQDCCESVWISDVVGDINDLLGTPILMAEEVTKDMSEEETSESGTWTFYKFATIKGCVDITWRGESNGYYSESVDYRQIKKGDEIWS